MIDPKYFMSVPQRRGRHVHVHSHARRNEKRNAALELFSGCLSLRERKREGIKLGMNGKWIGLPAVPSLDLLRERNLHQRRCGELWHWHAFVGVCGLSAPNRYSISHLSVFF